MMPDRAIAGVARAEQLTLAGKGKVNIDSGVVESVMPRGMLEKEPLVEGEAKRLGVQYVAAWTITAKWRSGPGKRVWMECVKCFPRERCWETLRISREQLGLWQCRRILA